MSVTLEPSLDDLPKLVGKGGVVKEMVDAKARSGCFARVGRANALLGGADTGSTKLDLFQSVDDLMEIKDEVGTVGDEKAASAVQPLALESLELFEERGDMDDNARSNKTSACRVDETCQNLNKVCYFDGDGDVPLGRRWKANVFLAPLMGTTMV